MTTTMKVTLKTCAAVGGLVLAGLAGFAGVAAAASVPGQGTWETTLQKRDLDGDSVTDAFYDTELDITWLRNADINGYVNWHEASSWAANLVIGGYSDWRLPTMVDTGASGCDFSVAGGTDCGYNVQTKTGSAVFSEMAHLWYETLGNKAPCPPGSASCAGFPQPGHGLTNTGEFQSVQTRYYWSGLEYPPGWAAAWDFDTLVGYQSRAPKYSGAHAMAVRPGDVPAVSEPAAAALMLMGLGALALARRRRAR